MTRKTIETPYAASKHMIKACRLSKTVEDNAAKGRVFQ